MTAIFVFGSNLAGRHGKGAANYARHYHGAVYGVGEGRTGDAYALPTKDEKLRTLSLLQISEHARKFIWYAVEHPELTFILTRVGCGLAGYNDKQIAPFFADCPDNVIMPDSFRLVISNLETKSPSS